MQIRKEYEKIAMKCLDIYPELINLKQHPCRIAFLGSSKVKKSRGELVQADCIKFSKRYKWLGDYDFVITVYEPNCYGLDNYQMQTLLRHELNHIGVTVNEDNTANYFLAPHDIQDFRCIVEEEGLDWSLPTGETSWEKEDIEGQMTFDELK